MTLQRKIRKVAQIAAIISTAPFVFTSFLFALMAFGIATVFHFFFNKKHFSPKKDLKLLTQRFVDLWY